MNPENNNFNNPYTSQSQFEVNPGFTSAFTAAQPTAPVAQPASAPVAKPVDNTLPDLSEIKTVDFSKPLTSGIKRMKFSAVGEKQRVSFLLFNPDGTLKVATVNLFTDPVYGSFAAPKSKELQQRCIQKYGKWSQVHCTLVAVAKLSANGMPMGRIDENGQPASGYEIEVQGRKFNVQQLQMLQDTHRGMSLADNDLIFTCKSVQFQTVDINVNFGNPRGCLAKADANQYQELMQFANSQWLSPTMLSGCGVYQKSDEQIEAILNGTADIPSWAASRVASGELKDPRFSSGQQPVVGYSQNNTGAQPDVNVFTQM